MYKTNIFEKACCKFRYYYEKHFPPRKCYLSCERNPDRVSELIYQQLTKDEPCMIARFGSTELYCLANYLGTKKGFIRSFIPFLFAKAEPWWIMPQRVADLKNCSGVFSAEQDGQIKKFCEMMLVDMKNVDILGSWVSKEYLIEPYISAAVRVHLPYLEPYYSREPWSRALEGKRVLVVHPFASQIHLQYMNHRSYLFNDSRVLPDFEIRTLQAVQSLCGADNGFATWFDALEYMKAEMNKIDYDICIIGCGAYGFHLAAHAKRMGKKAIHLGGATQLLFGIKGNRWENPEYGVKEWDLPQGFYTNMFNEYWVKPGAEGRPKNADSVEGACYW
jgi:hypothetical protein